MATAVLLAPVGSGKTEIALNRLSEIVAQKPFARIWALFATKRQEDAFRQRLAEWDAGRSVYFNVEFFNFYELYSRLLDIAGRPPRRLSAAGRLGFLRVVLALLQDDIEYYKNISSAPGFVRAVGDFIYELKQNRVYPDVFARAASSAKDRELSLIYTFYQERLIDENLVDREGEGWLALDVIQEDDSVARDVDLLVVDGYDQFTVVQADLLTLLANRAQETLVTLTTVPGREQTLGRRFQRALERLEASHAKTGQVLTQHVYTTTADRRHPDLIRLSEQILRLDVVPQTAQDGIALLEAPDPAQETALVLRRVKRLLLAGVRPDEILIALRSWERYQHHFVAYARAYGLPLALHYGEALAQNPALTALLSLLKLKAFDFPRRELLDVLGSPYFNIPGLDSSAVAELDRLSRAYQVVGGRESWLMALTLAQKERENYEAAPDQTHPQDEEDSGYISPFIVQQLAQLHDALQSFFDHITPAEESTIGDYVYWLEHLIGPDRIKESEEEDELLPEEGYRLQMIWQLREPAPDYIISRDLAAMDEFKRLLRGLLSSQELLIALGESPLLSWNVFLSDLAAMLSSVAVARRPARTGRVLVTTATDARGLPHEYVFIVGLAEGLFPAQTGEDPLYLDTERGRLRSEGVFLETQAERSADDGLFYELISLPQRKLTLSRPTVEDGKRWIESHLWRGVREVFPELSPYQLNVGAVVPADDAASLDEAVLAAAHGLTAAREAVTLPVRALYGWLQEQPYWRLVEKGRLIERGRLSPKQPFNRYSGRLDDAALLALVAADLGPDRTWSASQFNELASCGFRFFARRMLSLDTLEEPEEEINTLQLGTLYHEILEETYRQLREEGLAVTEENLDRALVILSQVTTEKMSSAPERLGFSGSGLWQHDKNAVTQKLQRLVRQDFSGKLLKIADQKRAVYALEARFNHLRLMLGDDMGDVTVRGAIDRIDQIDDVAWVIDYKSGSASIPVSMMAEGRNFQMMVYLAAAEDLLRVRRAAALPQTVAGGIFWHIGSGKASGETVLNEHQDEIAMARHKLAEYIRQVRKGDFAVKAPKIDKGKCFQHCEFYKLCRISTTSQRKL